MEKRSQKSPMIFLFKESSAASILLKAVAFVLL
uniref:Uncharacterized protein n=1 Tax=virus sp. ct1Uu26 TaxID=2826789 RepID=A0A8S5R8Z7_9VIRU|nr:MAG TPA: hypothetical protein [virus sp. ct1Uu26]